MCHISTYLFPVFESLKLNAIIFDGVPKGDMKPKDAQTVTTTINVHETVKRFKMKGFWKNLTSSGKGSSLG